LADIKTNLTDARTGERADSHIGWVVGQLDFSTVLTSTWCNSSCMTDRAPPAGWVVQVTIPAPAPLAPPSGRWIGPAALSAPSFKYFNVAIADLNMAVEATARQSAEAEPRETRVVRELSAREIDALSLKAGEVKLA
jgi:hypothetical protein